MRASGSYHIRREVEVLISLLFKFKDKFTNFKVKIEILCNIAINFIVFSHTDIASPFNKTVLKNIVFWFLIVNSK